MTRQNENKHLQNMAHNLRDVVIDNIHLSLIDQKLFKLAQDQLQEITKLRNDH